MKIVCYVNKEDIQCEVYEDVSGLHGTILSLLLKRYYEENTLIEKTFACNNEHLVQIVGEMVEKRLLSVKDIEVEIHDSNGKLCKSKYDKEGYLHDWKFGFFLPNTDWMKLPDKY